MKAATLCAVVIALTLPLRSWSVEPDDTPHRYYFVGAFLSHPYVRDIKLGLNYARRQLGVDIIISGPQGPDFGMQIQAMKDAISSRPDGIIIPLWSESLVPSVEEAMAQQIPVIAIEAAPADHGAATFIGLDNYRSGRITARALIERGGHSGKLGLILNKATNTSLKRSGLLDELRDTDWTLIAEYFDDTNTDGATGAAIELLRNHPEISGIVGLNSSSGVGIGNALGQLGMIGRDLTIIAHDREETVLEFIDMGIIDATIVTKTALMSYLAVSTLEDYLGRRAFDVPISSGSRNAGVITLPEEIFTGAVIVDSSNVEHFLRSNLPALQQQP